MDIYPGLLVLLLSEGKSVDPYIPLCDMDRCCAEALVQRGVYRVCLDHGAIIPGDGGVA